MSVIERKRGTSKGRNIASAYNDLIWLVSTATDMSLCIEGQTKQALDTLQDNLVEMGSDKSRIVSSQVYIANMSDKAKMDEIWQDWLGSNPEHWPQRACLGVALEGNTLIEITVTAVR